MKYILFVTALLLNIAVQAQESTVTFDKVKFGKIKQQARQAITDNDFYVALSCYQKLHELKPEDLAITNKLAQLEYSARNYNAAEALYEKVVAAKESKYASSIFYYALALKNNGKYGEAETVLKGFKKQLKHVEDKRLIRQYKYELAGIKLQDSLSKANTPYYVDVKSMGNEINGEHIESSPIPYGDKELLYTALKTDKNVYYKKESGEFATDVDLPKRKFYVAKKQGGSWSDDGELAGVNAPEFDIANGALSPDGERLYFTKCAPNWQNKVICKLYVSTQSSGGNWNAPVELNNQINLPNYTTTQPSVGFGKKETREVIYFVSDRPGGRGGMDIWSVSYDKKRKIYLKPINCGGKINTSFDEITPYFYESDSTLYFSSNGHPGIGGYDVFSNRGYKNKWNNAKPSNMGLGINTSYDEQYFILDRDTSQGYFTSNRVGGKALLSETCCDDLYQFKYNEIKAKQLIVNAIEPESGDCLKNYTLSVFTKKKDGFVFTEEVDVEDCEQQIEVLEGSDYKLVFTKNGFVSDSTVVTPEREDVIVSFEPEKEATPEQPVAVVEPEPVVEPAPEPVVEAPKEEVVVPTVEVAMSEGFVLKDVYFDFDKAILKPKTKEVLDNVLLVFLNKYPTTVIELSAHTDSFGANSYNKALSQRRANSVVQYLVDSGIAKSRLVSKGYGEAKPIATNDTDEGRATNRRVEFKVLKK